MNDYRYPILKEIGAEKSKNYIHILNTMDYPPLVTESVLMQMKTDGLIQGSLTPHGNVSLSEKGVVMLLQLENALIEEHTQQSKQERQQRFENKMLIAQTLISIGSFILGLVVEHFSGIVASLF